MGPKSRVNSSNYTAPTRADSIGTERRAPVADSEMKKIDLNGKFDTNDSHLISARVTYADGFNKSESPQPQVKGATAAATDAKNRTIGHYVVGKCYQKC